MRLQNRYKKFSKLNNIFKEFPYRILKFHRTKWKKIQALMLKKKKKKNWSTNALLFTKRWFSYKLKYTSGFKLKNYFDCLFDKAYSILFFKKLKFLNKKLDKILDYCVYLIKPEFRIDIFLWRLNFFSSCYESRRYINNKKIQINNKIIHPNYFLKKGDIIFFDFLFNDLKFSLQNLPSKKINKSKILSFLEVDYYTNTVVVLKNYNELTEKEIMFFISNYFDVLKFKAFIE